MTNKKAGIIIARFQVGEFSGTESRTNLVVINNEDFRKGMIYSQLIQKENDKNK